LPNKSSFPDFDDTLFQEKNFCLKVWLEISKQNNLETLILVDEFNK
jgi:hypothetical protein